MQCPVQYFVWGFQARLLCFMIRHVEVNLVSMVRFDTKMYEVWNVDICNIQLKFRVKILEYSNSLQC